MTAKRRLSSSADLGLREYDRCRRRRILPDIHMTGYKNVPANWILNDDDINENHVDTVIQGCKEKSEDGIAHQWWNKPEVHVFHKAKETAILASEDPSLPRDVLSRLKTLMLIEKHIEEDGDTCEQMVNVKAVEEAYRTKQLRLDRGWVSYWSNGKQISNGLVKFDYDDVDRCGEMCQGVPFWVEGVHLVLGR